MNERERREMQEKREKSIAEERERTRKKAAIALNNELYDYVTRNGTNNPAEIRKITEEIYERNRSRLAGGLDALYRNEGIGKRVTDDVYTIMLSAVPESDTETRQSLQREYMKFHGHAKNLAHRVPSLVLMLFGIVLILNSASGITGFVVMESVGKTTSSIAGIILFIVGFVLSRLNNTY